MGGISLFMKKKSLSKFFPNFHLQDWVQVPIKEQQEKQRFGQYKTLRNKVTRQQIDRYDLTFISQKQQQIYQDCFMQRLRQQHLVNAFHYQPQQNQGLCADTRGATVYIQHIPIRLSDITDIPINQSVYILKCSLQGFGKLFKQAGYFKVIQQFIGIDREGHVRVWLNADLSKNYPYGLDEDPSLNKDSQRKMVRQIISLIQQNTSFTFKIQQDSGGSSQINIIPFSLFLQKLNIKPPNFNQSLSYLQQYTIQNQIKIPKHCSSIIQIFNQDYGQDFNLLSDQSLSQHQNQQLFSNALGSSDQRQSHHSQQKQKSVNKSKRLSKNSKSSVSNMNKNNNLKLSRNEQNQTKIPPIKINEQLSNPQEQQNNQVYRQFQPISTYKPLQRHTKRSDQQGNGGIRVSSAGTQKKSEQIRKTQNGQNCSLHGSSASQSISQNSNLYINIPQNFRNDIPIQINDKKSIKILSQGQKIKKQSINSSDQISIHSSSSLPKVTFNYVNPTINSHQTTKRMGRISQNSNQHSPDHELDLQLNDNISNNNDNNHFFNQYDSQRFNQKHYDNSNNDINHQHQSSEQLDPQIMKDLIKLYPQLNQNVVII